MARPTVLDAAACQLLLLGRSTAAAARTAASTKDLLSLLARCHSRQSRVFVLEISVIHQKPFGGRAPPSPAGGP